MKPKRYIKRCNVKMSARIILSKYDDKENNKQKKPNKYKNTEWRFRRAFPVIPIISICKIPGNKSTLDVSKVLAIFILGTIYLLLVKVCTKVTSDFRRYLVWNAKRKTKQKIMFGALNKHKHGQGSAYFKTFHIPAYSRWLLNIVFTELIN
jgi:hypothetical protein